MELGCTASDKTKAGTLKILTAFVCVWFSKLLIDCIFISCVSAATRTNVENLQRIFNASTKIASVP
jgi:hypothetical protein